MVVQQSLTNIYALLLPNLKAPSLESLPTTHKHLIFFKEFWQLPHEYKTFKLKIKN